MTTRPRITDPHRVPVVGVDDHLPPLPPERLSASVLRAYPSSAWSAWVPHRPGDDRTDPRPVPVDDEAALENDKSSDESTTPELSAAAVLVPLITRPSGLTVLLTRRSAHLRHHAGQISFPGGRAETDDGSLVATALREAAEEIGLSSRHVEVLGTMPLYATGTGFAVTPVVALVHPPFDLELDRVEVDEAFEVPMDFLMNPAHHCRHLFQLEGHSRTFLSMLWRDETSPVGGGEFFIWGATAAMLRNLYEFLREVPRYD